MCDRNGANLIVLGFDANPREWRDKLDGLIIPGGRDIDPKFYGQANTNSKFNRVDAGLRYNFCKRFVEECHPKMPIFGICYGFQVLNCIFGGNMKQTMKKSHYSKRTVRLANDSVLQKTLGKDFFYCTCYHHQCLDELAPPLRATAWDADDNTIHAFEYSGKEARNILGVLWHPESIYSGESIQDHNQDTLKQFHYFFDISKEYLQTRNATGGTDKKTLAYK